MNQNKLKQYNLTGSFHTFTVTTEGLIDAKSETLKDAYKVTVNQDNTRSTTTINLNKINGDLLSFKDFKEKFEVFRTSIGMENYRFQRADFRLDSYDKEHYQAFSKLNKYLISAVALTYNVKNCYKTDNLFSHKQLSIAIKNDYFQLENYDRNAKSLLTENHQETAQSRLEERTVSKEFRRLYSDDHCRDGMEILKEEFTINWFNRWDKALENLDAVGNRYNDELERIYREYKDAYPVRFRSTTEFVMQYQDSIFSQKQLINLLKRLGVASTKERAKSYKKRYGIEYISKKDAKTAVEEIKRATLDYFKGGTDVPFLQNDAVKKSPGF